VCSSHKSTPFLRTPPSTHNPFLLLRQYLCDMAGSAWQCRAHKSMVCAVWHCRVLTGTPRYSCRHSWVVHRAAKWFTASVAVVAGCVVSVAAPGAVHGAQCTALSGTHGYYVGYYARGTHGYYVGHYARGTHGYYVGHYARGTHGCSTALCRTVRCATTSRRGRVMQCSACVRHHRVYSGCVGGISWRRILPVQRRRVLYGQHTSTSCAPRGVGADVSRSIGSASHHGVRCFEWGTTQGYLSYS
jgi:hypothetical protein